MKQVFSTVATSLAVLAFVSVVGAHQVQAQSQTAPEADEESSSSGELSLDATTTEQLKARIEKIVEERRNQIMGVISDLGKTRKGMIGEVQRVSAETVSIKTSKGTQILALNSDVIITKKGKAIPVETISVGDWVTVIGMYVDDTFTPELIDVSSESLRPKAHMVMLGTITDISKNLMVITPKNKSEAQKVTITKQSELLDSDGNPVELKKITEDSTVLFVAQQNGSTNELKSLKLLAQ